MQSLRERAPSRGARTRRGVRPPGLGRVDEQPCPGRGPARPRATAAAHRPFGRGRPPTAGGGRGLGVLEHAERSAFDAGNALHAAAGVLAVQGRACALAGLRVGALARRRFRPGCPCVQRFPCPGSRCSCCWIRGGSRRPAGWVAGGRGVAARLPGSMAAGACGCAGRAEPMPTERSRDPPAARSPRAGSPRCAGGFQAGRHASFAPGRSAGNRAFTFGITDHVHFRPKGSRPVRLLDHVASAEARN